MEEKKSGVSWFFALLLSALTAFVTTVVNVYGEYLINRIIGEVPDPIAKIQIQQSGELLTINDPITFINSGPAVKDIENPYRWEIHLPNGNTEFFSNEKVTYIPKIEGAYAITLTVINNRKKSSKALKTFTVEKKKTPMAYNVYIKTSSKRDSGTDEPIYITLHGEQSSTKPILLNGPIKNNKAGKVGGGETRSLTVNTDVSLGELKTITLSIGAEKAGHKYNGWRPESVYVSSQKQSDGLTLGKWSVNSGLKFLDNDDDTNQITVNLSPN